MKNAFEAVKRGYSAAVKWVDDNPTSTLVLAVVAIIVTALVFK